MATVLAVDSDFELAVGEGNPVTARYRTSEVDLISRVTLDSGDVVSGTTKHTIWSVSRRSFVEMAELQVGELVDTELGVASVQGVEVINEPQAVYNLEIAGQHVFRIGKTGVLVHNVDPTEPYEQLAENALDVAPKKGFTVHPRVVDQLSDPRLGELAGKITPQRLNDLVNNKAARRFFDSRTGNINIIQEVDGKLVRISVARDEFKIISIGRIKERNIRNLLGNGGFTPLK